MYQKSRLGRLTIKLIAITVLCGLFAVDGINIVQAQEAVENQAVVNHQEENQVKPEEAEKEIKEIVADEEVLGAPVDEPAGDLVPVDPAPVPVPDPAPTPDPVPEPGPVPAPEPTPEIVPVAEAPEAPVAEKALVLAAVAGGITIGTLAISGEMGGTTTTIPPVGNTSATSSENDFTTPTNTGTGSTISPENHFTTLGDGNPGTPTLSISPERSFTTLNTTGGSDTDEHSFTTLDDNDGGCTSNCGGGGGGGGRRRRTPPKPPENPLLPCSLYLREYIHIGRANNPDEVRKLQAFLNVFEGEHLAVTGVYTQVDFAAVERFQRKYLGDVLEPWGISQSTGYVFITTRLAINNIYCARSTQHDLDLRNFYPQVYTIIGHTPFTPGTELPPEVQPIPEPEPGATTTPEVGSTDSRFHLAALAMLNFFKLSPGCALIVLLALAILFMLFLIWRLSRYPDTREPSDFDDDFYPVETTSTSAVPEDEVIVDDDTTDEFDLFDEDPTQPPLDRIQ